LTKYLMQIEWSESALDDMRSMRDFLIHLHLISS